jgi:pyruvate/2-oxoglutarate dehydrogenase complex dihydrolipoamide dehydrogenase (E3) component
MNILIVSDTEKILGTAILGIEWDEIIHSID